MTDDELKLIEKDCAGFGGRFEFAAYDDGSEQLEYTFDGDTLVVAEGIEQHVGEPMARMLNATRALIAAIRSREVCWSCPGCEFTFAAYHAYADGTFSCPVCEVERYRAVFEAAGSVRDDFDDSELPRMTTSIRDLCAAVDAARKEMP